MESKYKLPLMLLRSRLVRWCSTWLSPQWMSPFPWHYIHVYITWYIFSDINNRISISISLSGSMSRLSPDCRVMSSCDVWGLLPPLHHGRNLDFVKYWPVDAEVLMVILAAFPLYSTRFSWLLHVVAKVKYLVNVSSSLALDVVDGQMHWYRILSGLQLVYIRPWVFRSDEHVVVFL